MKQYENMTTRFIDEESGNELANNVGLLPISLFKGMVMTIHGHSRPFEVLDWSYTHGHPDENAGLRIILKAA